MWTAAAEMVGLRRDLVVKRFRGDFEDAAGAVRIATV